MENEQRLGWGYWISLFITVASVIILSHFDVIDGRKSILALLSILIYCTGVLLLILGIGRNNTNIMLVSLGILLLALFVGIIMMF